MGWIRDIFKQKGKVQPTSVTDENFEHEILESDLPVLLDIWTPTCVHCHKLEPIIMDMAKKYHGRLKVTELNGADSPQTMARLRVRGTPTVVYFWRGKEVDRVAGFRGSLYHHDFVENELLPMVEADFQNRFPEQWEEP